MNLQRQLFVHLLHLVLLINDMVIMVLGRCLIEDVLHLMVVVRLLVDLVPPLRQLPIVRILVTAPMVFIELRALMVLVEGAPHFSLIDSIVVVVLLLRNVIVHR